MLLRKSIFALAAIAAIATSALASTSASAFADGSVRFAHIQGGLNLTSYRDRPTESIRSFRHTSGKRQH
jgi:hypothetical protein